MVAQAAGSIAGPTHRNMGTVGGNLCLDTRCIFYNQSEWWRGANHHCLKTTGEICHVAPKSRGVCFATFSGDLAPALLTLGAEVDLAGPAGRRTLPLAGPLHRPCPPGSARPRATASITCAAAGRVRHRGARAKHAAGLRSAYDKIRIRRSIEYPVARRRRGAAARRAIRLPTCASPSPAPIRGRFCSKAPQRALRQARSTSACSSGLDDLVRDQIMSMKTTFTPGHYRRRVAGVLARRLVQRLWDPPA